MEGKNGHQLNEIFEAKFRKSLNLNPPETMVDFQ
jgi:hypothetical protein